MQDTLPDAENKMVVVGDRIVVAERRGNIAGFRFGTVADLDTTNLRFKIKSDKGVVSAWMNWYYLDIAVPNYCKVLRLR